MSLFDFCFYPAISFQMRTIFWFFFQFMLFAKSNYFCKLLFFSHPKKRIDFHRFFTLLSFFSIFSPIWLWNYLVSLLWYLLPFEVFRRFHSFFFVAQQLFSVTFFIVHTLFVWHNKIKPFIFGIFSLFQIELIDWVQFDFGFYINGWTCASHCWPTSGSIPQWMLRIFWTFSPNRVVIEARLFCWPLSRLWFNQPSSALCIPNNLHSSQITRNLY